MNKRYRLGEIEEAVSEMEELIGLEDDIAEIDDDFQIVVSGWSVYVKLPPVNNLRSTHLQTLGRRWHFYDQYNKLLPRY